MMAAAIFSGGARVPSPPSFATSMTISASSGSSYGSSMPVNPLILPALAALYSPLGSRCSQTYLRNKTRRRQSNCPYGWCD